MAELVSSFLAFEQYEYFMREILSGIPIPRHAARRLVCLRRINRVMVVRSDILYKIIGCWH
jgi:hypothetical protein